MADSRIRNGKTNDPMMIPHCSMRRWALRTLAFWLCFLPASTAFSGTLSEGFFSARVHPSDLATRAADRTQELISEQVLSTARWADAFFGDTRYWTEENRTSLRVRLDAFLQDGEDIDVSTSFNLRLSLPKTENRLRLVFSGYDYDDLDTGRSLDEDDYGPDDPDRDAFEAALQGVFKATEKYNISIKSGLRWRDGPQLFVEPRYRLLLPLDPWDLRFTQTVKYWTDDGWESKTRFDLERSVSPRLFLRNTAEARWFEEDRNVLYDFRISLTQTVDRTRAVEYQCNTYFKNQSGFEGNGFREVNFRVRYRQILWRPWIRAEIAPEVSFRREKDYRAALGVFGRIEFVFGGEKAFQLDMD